MAVPSASAEVAIKKLARVGGNTICPNCGTEKKFGFGTVCMKYLTFVCNECKSSHQAISHRCKSLTMSSWTDGEIIQIRTVGGNDRARATWLAMAPPPGQNGRPSPGSSIDVYKSFIVDVYERKQYYRESTDSGDVNEPVSTPVSAPVPAPAVTQRQQQQRLETRVPVAAPKPPAPVVADLLDFGAFDTVAPPAVSSASTNLFGEFTAPTPAPATAAPIFDPFGNNGPTPSAVATTTSTTGMDMFGTTIPTNTPSVTIPAVTNSFGGFDPFGAGGNSNGSSAPQSTAMKPPIMNNSAIGSSNNIGMMMGNMNMNNAIGGSIMMNHPPANMNGNMMMGHNNNMGSNGMMNHQGFGGTTNMYGNGMGNNNSTMMNGYPTMMGANAGMKMMGGANATNHQNMNTAMSSTGMQLPNSNTMMMTMNGFQNNNNNYSSNGSFPMMNGSSMGGINSSTTAKSISTNFGTNPNHKSQQQHDPFANLGL